MKDILNMEWHDAILYNINIDRKTPGLMDTVELIIIWPDNKKNRVVFSDVYLAKFDLKFGVIGNECISHVTSTEKDDDDYLELIKIWAIHYDEIKNLTGLEIRTISTNSLIKIFSKSVSIENADS